MNLTRAIRFRLHLNLVAKFVEKPFAREGASIDERDVEENVVEVGFGDRRPDRASHLTEDSFLREPLTQFRQDPLVVQRLAQAKLALFGGQTVTFVPARELILFDLL